MTVAHIDDYMKNVEQFQSMNKISGGWGLDSYPYISATQDHQHVELCNSSKE